jgi:hypothetical protein
LAESWSDGLVGMTRAEAAAVLAARGVPVAEAGARGEHGPCAVIRVAGPPRPGTEPRVVRVRRLAGGGAELVCAGFLPGPGTDPAAALNPADLAGAAHAADPREVPTASAARPAGAPAPQRGVAGVPSPGAVAGELARAASGANRRPEAPA